MKVEHVVVEHVHQIWPQVENHIKLGMPYSQGDYTLEQIKHFVTTGQWVLIVIVQDKIIIGALTINFFNRPNDRVAFITTIGGKGVINTETVNQLKKIS